MIDTQLFLDAFRDPIANEVLQRFHRAFAPFEYLSVVVAQELRAGVRRERDRKGDLLSDMARTEGLEIGRVSKSFANDVLLALSCREAAACS